MLREQCSSARKCIEYFQLYLLKVNVRNVFILIFGSFGQTRHLMLNLRSDVELREPSARLE